MKKIIIEQITQSNRNIVMHFKDNLLVGINFFRIEEDEHLYSEDIYLENESFFNYLKRKSTELPAFGMLLKYEEQEYERVVRWIDDKIWEYVQVDNIFGYLDDYDNGIIDKEGFRDILESKIISWQKLLRK